MSRISLVLALVGALAGFNAHASVRYAPADRALHDRIESVPEVELTPAELSRLGKDKVAQVKVYARCIAAAQESALACGWLTAFPRQPAGTMTGALQSLLDDAWRNEPSKLLMADEPRAARSLERSRLDACLRHLGQKPPKEPWAGGRPGSAVPWDRPPIDLRSCG